MVETQLRRRGIRDERVLGAMREIPREEFVPAGIARGWPTRDAPIHIGYGQTISQPYMTALMAEVLELDGHRDRAGGGRRLRLRRRGAGHAGGARDRRWRSFPALARAGAREPAAHGPRRQRRRWSKAMVRWDTPSGALRRDFGGGRARRRSPRRCSTNWTIPAAW